MEHGKLTYKSSEEDKSKMLQMKKEGYSTKEIAKKFNLHESSVWSLLKTKGYGFSIYKFSKEKRAEIVNKYINEDVSCRDLAKEYGMSESGISNMLKQNNVSVRQIQGLCNRVYNVNEKYFEKIDTEDKAYFLGLLYADGHNNNEGFRISLQERDKDILEVFKRKIEFSGELKFVSKKNKNWQNQFALSVFSMKISNDLNKLGCFNRKSLVLSFPFGLVPDDLLHHFVRGVWDGDGCFYINKNQSSKNVISVISSVNFIESLKTILDELGFCNNVYSVGQNKVLEINNGTNNTKVNFLEWLYKNATIYFERKYSTQTKIKEYYERKK